MAELLVLPKDTVRWDASNPTFKPAELVDKIQEFYRHKTTIPIYHERELMINGDGTLMNGYRMTGDLFYSLLREWDVNLWRLVSKNISRPGLAVKLYNEFVQYKGKHLRHSNLLINRAGAAYQIELLTYQRQTYKDFFAHPFIEKNNLQVGLVTSTDAGVFVTLESAIRHKVRDMQVNRGMGIRIPILNAKAFYVTAHWRFAVDDNQHKVIVTTQKIKHVTYKDKVNDVAAAYAEFVRTPIRKPANRPIDPTLFWYYSRSRTAHTLARRAIAASGAVQLDPRWGIGADTVVLSQMFSERPEYCRFRFEKFLFQVLYRR